MDGSYVNSDERRLPVSGQRAAGRDHDAGPARTEWPGSGSTHSGQGANVTLHFLLESTGQLSTDLLCSFFKISSQLSLFTF